MDVICASEWVCVCVGGSFKKWWLFMCENGVCAFGKCAFSRHVGHSTWRLRHRSGPFFQRNRYRHHHNFSFTSFYAHTHTLHSRPQEPYSLRQTIRFISIYMNRYDTREETKMMMKEGEREKRRKRECSWRMLNEHTGCLSHICDTHRRDGGR